MNFQSGPGEVEKRFKLRQKKEAQWTVIDYLRGKSSGETSKARESYELRLSAQRYTLQPSRQNDYFAHNLPKNFFFVVNKARCYGS